MHVDRYKTNIVFTCTIDARNQFTTGAENYQENQSETIDMYLRQNKQLFYDIFYMMNR